MNESELKRIEMLTIFDNRNVDGSADGDHSYVIRIHVVGRQERKKLVKLDKDKI